MTMFPNCPSLTGDLVHTLESCSRDVITCLAENKDILVAGHAGTEGRGRIWNIATGQRQFGHIDQPKKLVHIIIS